MKNDKPNLDLIQMVQRARMQHDADAKPSDVPAVYWIEAKRPDGPAPTARSGQWMLDIALESVDSAWETVKTATEQGELGYKAKVSTASRRGDGTRALCVCTYDGDDQSDVARVRQALTRLGLDGDWTYEIIQRES